VPVEVERPDEAPEIGRALEDGHVCSGPKEAVRSREPEDPPADDPDALAHDTEFREKYIRVISRR
jgi:hypothetical protein